MELAPPDMAITVSDDLASIPLFSEDLEEEAGGAPAAVRRLRRAVERADGLLIATPEYNHSLPGVLKNAIDWLSRPGSGPGLAGKPVAIVGATTGAWGTRLAQGALRQVLFATESLVLPAPGLFLKEASRAFDAEGRLSDARTRDVLGEVLVGLAAWIVRGR
jgi:chromate reductase